MNKLTFADYEDAIQYIDKTGSGVVYPLSISEMVQSGDIFTRKLSAFILGLHLFMVIVISISLIICMSYF